MLKARAGLIANNSHDFTHIPIYKINLFQTGKNENKVFVKICLSKNGNIRFKNFKKCPYTLLLLISRTKDERISSRAHRRFLHVFLFLLLWKIAIHDVCG